jgi:hypothetical protein
MTRDKLREDGAGRRSDRLRFPGSHSPVVNGAEVTRAEVRVAISRPPAFPAAMNSRGRGPIAPFGTAPSGSGLVKYPG